VGNASAPKYLYVCERLHKVEAVGWYSVIKTIKGHRYEYLQRTWREGKKVRTESHYIGPAEPAPGSALSRPPRASDFDGVITTPRVFYHGSPDELEGALRPSEEGTFGPGLYLTTHARATLYAEYDAGIAAKIAAGETGKRAEPQYDGTVYAFDVRELKLRSLKWERYQELCMALDPSGAPTPSAKTELQALLAAHGYDGLYILDEERHEMVVFPASLHKIKMIGL
jgi:hypothetical protein